MAVNQKQFARATVVSGTSATSRSVLFTASNGIAQIGQITCKNIGASAITVYFYIAPNSTTSGALSSQTLVTVGVGETEIVSNLIGHNLTQGQTLQAHETSGTDAEVTISGVEYR